MKFNKYIALAAFAASMLGFGACTDKVEYEPAEPEANAEVFFPSTASTTYSLEFDQNMVTVPISRLNASGDVTVQLSSTATVGGEATDIFTVPSAVVFANGSDKAEVEILFDFAQIKEQTTYQITLTIDDAVATEYGKRTQTISLQYAPWSAWQAYAEKGISTLGALYSGTTTAKIERRENLLDENEVEYRYTLDGGILPNPIVVSLNAETNIVRIAPQPTGEQDNGDEIMIADCFTIFNDLVGNPERAEPYAKTSFYNPATGMFTFNIMYYTVTDGKIYPWPEGFEYLQLPGFPDEELYFGTDGTVITAEGVENAVITVAKGSDVTNFALRMFDGALSDAQVEEAGKAIAADTDATLYAEGGRFEFPMTKTGMKTIVGVSYNEKGEPLKTSSYTFRYEMQGINWNEGWKTLGKGTFTDGFICMNFFDIEAPESWQVTVQEREDMPGYYRLVKPYATSPFASAGEVYDGHYYLEIDATDPDAVLVEQSLVSIDFGYGDMYAVCFDYGTLKDGVISFPADGTGMFIPAMYNPQTGTGGLFSGTPAGKGVNILYLPGVKVPTAGGDENLPDSNLLKVVPVNKQQRAVRQGARILRHSVEGTPAAAGMTRTSVRPARS